MLSMPWGWHSKERKKERGTRGRVCAVFLWFDWLTTQPTSVIATSFFPYRLQLVRKSGIKMIIISALNKNLLYFFFLRFYFLFYNYIVLINL